MPGWYCRSCQRRSHSWTGPRWLLQPLSRRCGRYSVASLIAGRDKRGSGVDAAARPIGGGYPGRDYRISGKAPADARSPESNSEARGPYACSAPKHARKCRSTTEPIAFIERQRDSNAETIGGPLTCTQSTCPVAEARRIGCAYYRRLLKFIELGRRRVRPNARPHRPCCKSKRTRGMRR